jgi:CDP-glucose 4,6-dehydratase
LLKLDASKAHFHLKWNPVYDIYRALEETVRWYRFFYGKVDIEQIRALTIEQIVVYKEAARKEKICWSED